MKALNGDLSRSKREVLFLCVALVLAAHVVVLVLGCWHSGMPSQPTGKSLNSAQCLQIELKRLHSLLDFDGDGKISLQECLEIVQS